MKNYSARVAIAVAAAIGIGGSASAESFLGSENSSNTYAGDVTWLALPSGTLVLQDYFGYKTGNTYLAKNPHNIFSTLTGGGAGHLSSEFQADTATTGISYYWNFGGVPIVFQGAATHEHIISDNVGNLPNPIGGLGPQTTKSGWTNPEVSVGIGLISDPRSERFLGFTNYVYLPTASFDFMKQRNVATPHQTTWVPELAYSEGLGKYWPSLRNWWLDVIGNVSVHGHGEAPFAIAPGVQFDTLRQSTSYDVKAFLRYNFMPMAHVAVGVEKSWGGNQVASGGVLQLIFGGPQSLGADDFLKGHLQFAAPLPWDMQLAVDLSHDFQREGGFKENFAGEIRITKFFMPAGAVGAPGLPVKAGAVMPTKAQPAEATFAWTGLYAGVDGGYAWTNRPSLSFTTNLGGAAAANTGTSPHGGFGGALGGYNWQAGSWVVGVETDIQGGNIKDQFARLVGPNFFQERQSYDLFGTGRGRIGYAAGNVLLYGTGGYAYALINNNLLINGVANPRENTIRSGYAAGGGVEWAVLRNWFVRVEYLYMNFGHTQMTAPVVPPNGVIVTTNPLQDTLQTVRVGATYKFATE